MQQTIGSVDVLPTEPLDLARAEAAIERERRGDVRVQPCGPWGCPRIAQQITLAFGIPIDRDVVRRILAVRYDPKPDSAGPSWLTVLGHAKDSLWSVDLFRCESAVLHTYWVLVVMDHWTRRIVGFGVHRGVVDGVALCRMFNHATCGQSPPTYLSADHDPLYRFHQWQANLRILNIREIKTVPYVPRSHPVVERLIGTVRREYLDCLLFWSGIEAFGTDGPNESFLGPVRLGGLDRRTNDANPRTLKHLVEAADELAVAIANQEAHRFRPVGKRP